MQQDYKVFDIPAIGFGTYKLKTQAEISYTLEHALRVGYRHIDTAQLYKNEHLVAHFLASHLPTLGIDCKRCDLWITTKVAYFTMLEGNEEKLRKSILQSCDYFGGYVDLYLIHASNPNDLKVWNILQEFQRAGKIRYIGLSNYNLERLNDFIKRLEEASATHSASGEHGIYMNQIEYNPFLNRDELVARCNELGIRITAYGSLYKTNEVLKRIAAGLSSGGTICTSTQVLLAWAASKNIVVIPMSKNPQHIEDNIKSMKIKLASDDIARLDSLNENYTRYAKHL
jgi:2,5-diketo-D-gluconate reductase B